MAVEYGFYKDEYGGTIIAEADWFRLERKAEARLQEFTFGRLTEPWCDSAKYALCEMAEFLSKNEEREGKSSENTDGYAVSYDLSQSAKSKLYGIAATYLLRVGLMDLEV